MADQVASAEQEAFDAELEAETADLTGQDEEAEVEAEVETEAAAEEGAPEAGTAERETWDKDRQARDQEAANTRKKTDDLAAENDRLKAALAAREAEAPTATVADPVPPSDEETALRHEYAGLEPLKALDEFASDEDRQTRALERERRQDMREQLDRFREQRTMRNEDRKTALSIINVAVRTYGGEEIRNELTAAVEKELKTRDQASIDAMPASQFRDLVRAIGAEIQSKRAAKGIKPAKPRPRTDDGRGGTAVIEDVKKTGSLEDVAAMMRKERSKKT